MAASRRCGYGRLDLRQRQAERERQAGAVKVDGMDGEADSVCERYSTVLGIVMYV